MPNPLVTASSNSVMNYGLGFVARIAKWYLSLWPALPSGNCLPALPLARAQIEYDDEVSGGFLEWFDGRIDLREKRVLDLGSGYGGRTARYKELGAARVTGLEIESRATDEGRDFAAARGVHASFVVSVGERLPFAEASFDIITSYDVFEHVENLSQVLNECWRVLAPGGTLYAVFPPFYHPMGTHFEGYVSKMPYA